MGSNVVSATDLDSLQSCCGFWWWRQQPIPALCPLVELVYPNKDWLGMVFNWWESCLLTKTLVWFKRFQPITWLTLPDITFIFSIIWKISSLKAQSNGTRLTNECISAGRKVSFECLFSWQLMIVSWDSQLGNAFIQITVVVIPRSEFTERPSRKFICCLNPCSTFVTHKIKYFFISMLHGPCKIKAPIQAK